MYSSILYLFFKNAEIDNKLISVKKSEGASSSESGTPIFESSVIFTKLWLSMWVNMTHNLFNP